MNFDKEKIKKLFEDKKKILVIGVITIISIYLLFFSGGTKQTQNQSQTQQAGKVQGQIMAEEKTKAEIEALRQQNLELQKKIEEIKKQPQKSETQKELSSIKELEETLKGQKPKKKETLKEIKEPIVEPQMQQPKPVMVAPPRIIKIDIPKENTQTENKAVEQNDKKQSHSSNDIFLPAGSFAQFTLTSGAYAPAGGEQMPVSGVIKKAFVGPNKSVIPLRGCFFVGKARGIIGEGIADIKPVTISCVLENGTTFEAELAGYVTDKNGKFGLPGKVQRHTGSFLATTGLSSFLGGLASGWSRAYEQETATASGEAVEKTVNILGNAFRYGALKGLAGIADAAKAFYESQLKELIPSVDVPAGAEGYIYITKGITIKGGGKNKGENIYPYSYNTVNY